MNTISKLFQEAKPLYFKRKHRRQMFRRSMGCLAVICITFGIVSRFSPTDRLIGFYEELYSDTSVDSVIETESFFPTDEFGLIKVV